MSHSLKLSGPILRSTAGFHPDKAFTPFSEEIEELCSQVAKDRIKEINHVRGLLAEYGIVMGRSVAAFNKGISSALVNLKERGGVSPLVAEEMPLLNAATDLPITMPYSARRPRT